MSVLASAVGAILAAILESSVLTHLAAEYIVGAQPAQRAYSAESVATVAAGPASSGTRSDPSAVRCRPYVSHIAT